MADSYTFLYQITGFSHTATQWVTDGTDIFWEGGDDQGSIYKYTVATNTHAKLVDASSFDIEDGNQFNDRITLMVFRKNIYVGIWVDGGATFVDPGDIPAKVYKVTPSGTVTTVIADFPHTTNVDNGDQTDSNLALYATESIIVAAYSETKSGGGATEEFITQFSTNGTSWSDGSESISETVITGTFVKRLLNKDYRTLGIYARYFISGGTQVIIIKNEGGAWTKVRGPETPSIFVTTSNLFEVAQDHFWQPDDLGEYTDDWSTYHQPSSQAGSILGLNMPFAASQNADNVSIRKLDTTNPPTGLVTDSTLATNQFAAGVQVDRLVRLNSGKSLLIAIVTGGTYPDWVIYERDVDLPPTPSAWGGIDDYTPPQMALPCSIDASGTFIYIAALFGANGIPVLLKLDTDLLSNSTLVFEPGAGSNIGVICGREEADTVWVAGDFDGTNVVEKTEDAGDTFTVKDDGVFGAVRVFAVGPDADNRVMVFDEDNGDILETDDDGTTWNTINASVTPEVNAIARLGKNVEESVFGNDGDVNNSINYSINSGDDLEDFQTGVYPNANATKLVVN